MEKIQSTRQQAEILLVKERSVRVSNITGIETPQKVLFNLIGENRWPQHQLTKVIHLLNQV